MKVFLLVLLTGFCGRQLAFSAAHVTYWNGTFKNWDDPSIWSPTDGLAPHAGDTYTLNRISDTPQTTVHNPITGNDVVFGGDSLTITGDSRLNLFAKAPGVDTKITFGRSGLIWNDGTLRAREDVTFTIEGLVTFTNNNFSSRLETTIDQTDASNLGSFRVGAELQGPGYLILQGGRTNSPTFDFSSENDTFSGTMQLLGGWLKLSGMRSLGFASLNLTSVSSLSGSIPAILDADYDIVSPGTLQVSGGLIRLDQHLTFDLITIGSQKLQPGTYTAEELIARFPTNFAPIGQGSTVTGKLTAVHVPEVGAATALLFSGLLASTCYRPQRLA